MTPVCPGKRWGTRHREARRRYAKDRPWRIARTALLALAGAGLIAAFACKPQPPPTAEEKYQAEMERQALVRNSAERRARDLTYFRDPRSGLCFAYVYERRDDETGRTTSSYAQTGGPAMSEVDCAKVGKLLVNPPPTVAPPTPEAP